MLLYVVLPHRREVRTRMASTGKQSKQRLDSGESKASEPPVSPVYPCYLGSVRFLYVWARITYLVFNSSRNMYHMRKTTESRDTSDRSPLVVRSDGYILLSSIGLGEVPFIKYKKRKAVKRRSHRLRASVA